MNPATIGAHTVSVGSWNPSRSPDDQFEYIDLSAVDNAAKRIVETTTTHGADAPTRARQLVAYGDVLVSTVRPNLNAIAMVPPELHGATASTGFTVLRPAPTLDGRYLFHWVRSPQFIGDMVRKATGASYPAVSDRIVKDSLIPLPPLVEQCRIAAILDAADTIRTKRRAILTHLDTLTQALFDSTFPPDSSPTVALDEIVGAIDSGTSPNCEARPATDDEWGVLKLGAVTYGRFQQNENKAYLGVIGSMAANEVRAGDVLMTRKNTRELVGAVALVDSVRPRLLLPDLVFRLHLDLRRVDRRYFQAIMMNRRTRPSVQGLSSGSAGSMPNISKARLRTLPIELPSLDTQQAFAARAARIEVQRANVQRALVADDELLASLQSRAFRGDL